MRFFKEGELTLVEAAKRLSLPKATLKNWVYAPMKSFWSTLKNELVHHRKFEPRQQAIEEITEYIEIFYNRQRKQERLGYLSPAAFTQRYYENLLAA